LFDGAEVVIVPGTTCSLTGTKPGADSELVTIVDGVDVELG
jgi:hypothetical protein